MSKSGSTMTTPTPMLEAGEPGLPDIAWLTRLANEMFRSQPGSPWPSDPTPTTPLGGFGATTPSAPMPPGSVAEVPQPTAAAVSVPTPGTAIPGETELRGPLGASPPIAASGFGLTSSSSPLPSVPTPTTPLGGFGATTPSAPMPPGSVAEVPQPTPAAVRVPTPGTAIPGETELRGPLGASPPIAAGGFGLTSSSSPLPSVPTPTTPLGGFGATTPSAPMPPGSVAEVPQPTPAAVRVPTPGTAIPGETELRGPLGASPPIAAGGFGLTSSSSPLPSVPTPTTPLGGFGATTPSAPMPPGSVAEVPQPTPAAVRVPTPGTAIPGETELRGPLGASPPIAAGGFGLTSSSSPLPSVPTPTTPLGGFGATTPSAPMPPGSVAEVPQPTPAAVRVPTPGTAIPGETELRGPLGASPPIAAGGFGLTSSSSPLPSVPTPTTPLGGFGATTPSAPMPPGSVAEVPQPTAAAVSVPPLGMAIPGETELRGLLGSWPPNAAGGLGLTPSSSPFPSVPAPTTPLGGFGATTPSAPMPPGSAAEVPQPTAAAVSMPTPGTAIPGETELRGLLGASPPIAVGGFGLTSSSSPLPSVPTPTTPLGGFGATTPSAPMPPGSAAEVPQPTAAAVSMPTPGTAIPGETELRGLLGASPPIAVGGFGL